ncbi:MAG TPA: F0F1 ATP synthase subunit A [Bacteroidia bacterium]|nr:F0F1 ATP synthase subunit A [Bacteroidia bacterium]
MSYITSILSKKTPLVALFLTIFTLSSFKSSAYEPKEDSLKKATETTTETKEKKFNAGKLITEHIGDAHEWHLWGEGEHAVAIPLPIIVYNKKTGLSVFSSSKLEGGEVYKGYKLEENKIVEAEGGLVGVVDEIENAKTNNESGIIDLSITKNVVSLFVSAFLLLWVFLSVAKAYKNRTGQAPKGLQSFVEPLIMFVRDDVAKPSIGAKYEKFMPYLLTVFFFIFINNLLGLIPIFPGGANLTGNIAVCAVLACLTLVIIFANSNGHYWRRIFAMPGVPAWVLIILTPIELLGVVLRPFVLMIRLFANITAGHIIALAFFSLIFIFGEMSTGAGLGVSILSVAFTVFMGLMELLVAFLQAYVFTLLSAMYFGAAVEEGHHDHAHDEHHGHEGAHPEAQIDLV